MTHMRKMLTKESFVEILNEENNVTLSRTEETEKLLTKRKKESTYHEGSSSSTMMMKKKKKTIEELVCKSEDFAHALGKFIRFTGEGIKKKFHYENFEFHGNKYGLEDCVVLLPEDTYNKPHVAIIKDIYLQGKKGEVYLQVQWFYRPEDVEKRYLKNWKRRDSRDLFYSFHRDDKVCAESVMYGCVVHFLTEDMHVPNREDHPGFVVQNAYHHLKKKMWNFADENEYFHGEQENEIHHLVSKTFSRLGDLPRDIVEDKIVMPSRHVPKRCNVVNEPYYKSILEKFGVLTGDWDRDNRLVELLEAVENKCRFTEEKLVSDPVTFWPNDVVPVVYALEKVFFDSVAKDIPKYNDKLEIVVDKLKKSRMLAERLLTGKLTPEEIVAMNPNELKAIKEDEIAKTFSRVSKFKNSRMLAERLVIGELTHEQIAAIDPNELMEAIPYDEMKNDEPFTFLSVELY